MIRVQCRHAVLALVLSSAAAAGQGDASPQPLLNVSSQDTYVYASWSEIPDALYRLQWRRARSGMPWTSLQTASARSAALPLSSRGVSYEVRVIAERKDDSDTSSTVVVSTRDRSDCRVTMLTGVFCTVADLRQYLADNNIGATDLTCRGDAVIELTLTSPNCRYQRRLGREMLVLDRSLGGAFQRPQIAVSPQAVATIARRALWGESGSNPFEQQPGTGRLIASGYASVGGVRQALSSNALAIRVTPGLHSRGTWFIPQHPVPGRYAIYHEGHELQGGGATKSAPEVIDWFLERGWQVIAMDMLLYGENEIDRTYQIDNHNDLMRQPFPEGADPIVLMLDPIKVMVDSIDAEAASQGLRPTILLGGRSGGGMLATVYSAIDPRIDVALEIAGMSPASAQLDTTVFRGIAAELDLTIPQLYDQVPTVLLQTAGGRLGSFHFYSSADPCCFAFPAGHPFVSYLNELSVTTRGRVRAYVGHQPVHGLDDIALARLGQFLDQIGLGAADGEAAVSSTTTAAPR